MATSSYWYNLQERVFLPSDYYQYSAKYKLIFDHREEFPNSPIPKCETVYQIVKCLKKIRSVEDSKRTGHLCSVLTKNMQQAVQAFIETHTQSIQKVRQELNISDQGCQVNMRKIRVHV